MTVDVFLSHSSLDAVAARQLRAALQEAGLTTWMAPDDVTSARPWAEQIGDAIERARLLVVLISQAANDSDHVAREVAMAVRRKLPLLPVRLENLQTVGSLDYLLQLVQHFDAYSGGMERHAHAVAARALALVHAGPTLRAAGAPILARKGLSRATRRTVTVLVSEVSATTNAGGELDPEALRALLRRASDSVREIVERHGGVIDNPGGESVMAVFGVPVLHEDDALRAVRAAAEIRETLASLDAELSLAWQLGIAFRLGVDTGEVMTGDPSADESLVSGEITGRARRLAEVASAGSVLLGVPTYALVRDAVAVEAAAPVSARGGAPLAAHRLISVARGAAGRARRLDTPLVGRERELDRLAQAHRQAEADRSCQLFTLLGTAGVGKSRLVAEFLTSVGGEATVLKGRCLPYGEGITYWPVREIVHQAAGINEGETVDAALGKLARLLGGAPDAGVFAGRIASAIGLSTEAAPQEEIFWATRKLLEQLSCDRPVVVVIEDIHWAEPALLDLLEHVADLARDAPILLLCPARPELLDRRPGWGGGKLNATTVLLEPLASEATERLIAALPGGRSLPGAFRARILAAAEGNPLYLEEMLGMLVDEGHLVEVDGQWQASGPVERVTVPPTVQALLAARLDQLTPTERAIAERGSVIGRIFEQAAVTALAPESLRTEVAGGLLALVRKELVRPDRSNLAAGDAFKFRHLLIRDAAYNALPKAERADLHERFADWLLSVVGERVAEYSEIVGYHLEQAHRYRVEVGERGERVDEIGGRAGELLASGGDRALGRGDASAAADLFGRAMAVLPRDRRWAAAATALASSKMLLGDIPTALAAFDDVIGVARSLGEERLEWRARVGRANATIYGGEAGDPGTAEDAIAVFDRIGDADGMAAAWSFRATLAGEAGDPSEADAAQQALTYARAAGNSVIEARAEQVLAARLLFGPTSSSEGVAQGERLLDDAGGNLRTEAKVRSALSALVAMRGDFDHARAIANEGLRMLGELGLTQSQAVSRTVAAVYIEMTAGRYDVAESELREAHAVLESIGASIFATSVLGALAEVLALLGKDDEALRCAGIAAEKAADADYDAQVRWRRARARVLVRRGELIEAEALARAAVEIATGTDDIEVQGDCFAVLADVLIGAGRSEAARAALREALDRYERKGNLVSAKSTKLAMEGLPA